MILKNKNNIVLRSLSTNPKEARSIGELASMTKLSSVDVMQSLKELCKRYEIIEANGKFSRGFIDDLDKEKNSSPILKGKGSIEHR